MPIERTIVASNDGAPLFQGGNSTVVNSNAPTILKRNSTFLVNLDQLSFAEILELTPEKGRVVYDTTFNVERTYNGIEWVTGGGGNIGQRAVTYSDLNPGALVGEIAYVNQSQGTQWLPGTVGGTYYPSGWYLWTGEEWVSDRDGIVEQIQFNIDGIVDKADAIHTHTKANITDFNDADYASQADGVLAQNSIQPNDNISELVNDVGYLEGRLVALYVTAYADPYIYSGYELDNVPQITRYDGTNVQIAQNVSNLTTDWTNRVSLTYV